MLDDGKSSNVSSTNENRELEEPTDDDGSSEVSDDKKVDDDGNCVSGSVSSINTDGERDTTGGDGESVNKSDGISPTANDGISSSIIEVKEVYSTDCDVTGEKEVNSTDGENAASSEESIVVGCSNNDVDDRASSTDGDDKNIDVVASTNEEGDSSTDGDGTSVAL